MKKAFSLVELIVVITILAILGTIAFISLNPKESNNTKYNIKIKYDGFWYYTDYYRETEDGCIKFTDKIKRDFIICGNYLIEK